jgi:ATP-binding cassette subfamily C protein
MGQQHPSTSARLAALSRLAGDLARFAGVQGWLAGGLMIAAALLEGVGLLLLIPILGVLINGPLDNVAGELLIYVGATTPAAELLWLLAGFLFAALLRAQIIHMRDLVLARIQLGFSRAQKIDVVGRLAHAGWGRLVTLNHAQVTSLINNDVGLAVVAAQFLLRIAVALLLIAVNSAIAFSLAPDLVALLFVFLALGALFLWATQRDAFSMGGHARDSVQAMLGTTQNLLSGLKTALAQEQQGWFLREFRAVQAEVFDSQFSFQHSQSGARRLFAIASALVATGLVAGGYWLDVNPASLIVVVAILARLSGPVLQLQQGAQQILFCLPSVVAVQKLRRDLPRGPQEENEGVRRLDGDLRLDLASYRHADGGGVGPLTLTIGKGEFLGIAGPTGAGKSTLVDLLAGLLVPQQGRMLVAGEALDGEGYAAWRRNLAYLGQQTFLFNDSLRANLTWSEEDCSEERIWAALELAGAADMVRGLEHGLDTPLGEHGVLFSGGERQRIALARALLKRPGFLILDEATSAIDIAAEEDLLERLHSLPDRPTIVMVAHRRESLARCDRVITLDHGRIG